MKTYILIAKDRKRLERIEDEHYNNIEEMLAATEIEDLSYFELSDFMEGVNDQEIDNLTNVFISYVRIG